MWENQHVGKSAGQGTQPDIRSKSASKKVRAIASEEGAFEVFSAV